MNKVFTAIAVGLIAFLAACTETQPPPSPNDPFFAGQEPFGAPIPNEATVVDNNEFKRLAAEEGFVLDSIKLREAQKQKAEAQFLADETAIKNLAIQNPVFQRVLKPPDPSVKVLGDGNYGLTVQGKSGPFEVVTLGPRSTYRQLLKSREQFQDTGNQLKVYDYGFNDLPENLRTGLATPESLSSASLETILAARLELGKRLAANPDTLEDAIPVSTTRGVRSEVNPDAKPSLYPANPSLEQGDGKGIDHEGNCAFNSFDPNGLYKNFWWKQKFYHTSVKAQGSRGTCPSFALAAALEGRIAIEQSRWVNLSEQYLWAKIAGQWEPREYGDGADSTGMAQEFYESKYGLPLEEVWNYNKSRSRIDHKDDGYYTKSCQDYDEFCSNASHQRKVVCTSVGSQSFCAYHMPPATGEKFKQTESENIYDWSSWSLPVDEMRSLLRNGHPMIASFEVVTGFDNPNGAGYVTSLSDADSRGNHVVQIVGFISAYRIASHPDLPQSVKQKAASSGGGYFILKNSWNYCYGDAGYVYVPVSWAEEYFHNVNVFAVNPSQAFKTVPNIPPTITITSPQNNLQVNQEFNLVNLKATATDADGSIASITWKSDLQGTLGTGSEISVSLSVLGPHSIIAIAKDNLGASKSAQIVVNVISQVPTATIGAPANNHPLYRNQVYPFEGNAEDGGFALECSNLAWASSKAGEGPWLGCNPNIAFSTNGTRTITLTATDNTNAKGTASVNINVVDPPPSGPPMVEITYPKTNIDYDPKGKVRLSYSLTDPGGVSGSQYTVVWKVALGRTTKTITPLNYALNNTLIYKYFIPQDYFSLSGCGDLHELKVSITVTDPEGLSDTDTVAITTFSPPC